MPEKFEVMLSNGIKIDFNPNEPDNLFSIIVKKILIPFYKKTNDWYKSIRTSLTEISSMRMRYGDRMPKLDYRKMLLREIEQKLGNEIDNVKGVDKIEVLFLNLDDYIEEIKQLINANFTKEEKMRTLGDLIAGLNTFEISELLMYYIKKSRK
ncbi:MAG: hypothetical protein ACTSWY_01155 [Promethearchaeota archaeon]